MIELFGRKWQRRELLARTGRIEQIAGVRRYRLTEGFEAGSEQIQVRTGAGLAYTVSPSRALDISLAEFGGAPISWLSSAGDVHPAYYDADSAGWLRTAAGGLLMTCGLSYVGAPGQDNGQEHGLHGRIHHSPARQVSTSASWDGDQYLMKVSGIAEETALFGDSWRLTRTIRSQLGHNWIELSDVVENAGFAPADHMILYHFNFGFPLLSEETTIDFPSRTVVPRDKGTPVEGYDRWQAPDATYQERVYYHKDFDSEAAAVTIRNPRFPLAGGSGTIPLDVRLSWSTAQLPRLVQWKMAGAGAHVLGIEPANCYVEGRAVERARGTLVTLEPGETRRYDLRLELFTSEAGMDQTRNG